MEDVIDKTSYFLNLFTKSVEKRCINMIFNQDL